jgi:hypothetical protein
MFAVYYGDSFNRADGFPYTLKLSGVYEAFGHASAVADVLRNRYGFAIIADSLNFNRPKPTPKEESDDVQ